MKSTVRQFTGMKFINVETIGGTRTRARVSRQTRNLIHMEKNCSNDAGAHSSSSEKGNVSDCELNFLRRERTEILRVCVVIVSVTSLPHGEMS